MFFNVGRRNMDAVYNIGLDACKYVGEKRICLITLALIAALVIWQASLIWPEIVA